MNIAKAIGAALLAAAAQRGHAGRGAPARRRDLRHGHGLRGLFRADAQGKWQGLDVDLCRAVAAAVFGDADKIKGGALNSQQRFTAQSGEVDVLTRNTTVTQQRDTALGIIHAGINFYDGQASWCPSRWASRAPRTSTAPPSAFRPARPTNAGRLGRAPITSPTSRSSSRPSTKCAFAAGRCDVFSTDASTWPRSVSKLQNPDDYVVLPEIISKPVRAPGRRRLAQHRALVAVRHDRGRGIRHHLQERGRPRSANPNIKRISASPPAAATWGWTKMGLPDRQAGGQLRELRTPRRPGQPLKIQRGLNAQWTQGGLMYTADP